jgi:hypothetical protein
VGAPARVDSTIDRVFLGKIMLVVAALLFVVWVLGGFLKHLR